MSRYGLVSSGAVRRFKGGGVSDTGTGPRGSISSDHINNPEQQRAGAGFSNAERDYGPGDAGGINARANARQWQVKLKGRKPAPPPRWKARWFSWPDRIAWDSGRGTPPAAEQEAGGLPSDSNMVTGQSWLDRNRRGET
jgi:hypothetical protein